MWKDFTIYYAAVVKRNKETFEDGHLIEYRYDDKIIEDNREFFKDCWKNHLSPYKALMYLEDQLNGEFNLK